MAGHLTFGQRVGAGFAAMIALAVVIGVISIGTLNGVVASKDRVITTNARLLADAAKLHADLAEKVAATRGFLVSPDQEHLDRATRSRTDFASTLGRLKQTVLTEEGRQQLNVIERLEANHEQAIQRVISLRRTATSLDAVAQMFGDQAAPLADQLVNELESFVQREERLLEEARLAATTAATNATRTLLVIVIATALIGIIAALLLARALARQIGESVGQIQNASAELQAAANQQATGAKEQGTAMAEITTTISELLATSRQIAESAQRVAQIAEQTAATARSGEGTVQKTQESITGIRRQVDLIVNYMLDLGKKSQQIGAVLEVVTELAEQTNILAINATIEAAGAGEAGKRFAVVAEEIRKLADRVAVSAKEIRVLVEDVRGAVNTTVMATESGSKAVEAGSVQFGEVASAFKQIAGVVTTTTEAAREIQLSTKQQATAVEQVNTAIVDVAQATRETEVSAEQTLQTASQLTGLSRNLQRLVQPRAA